MILQDLLFADTEKSGSKHPITAFREIKTRYSFALNYIKDKKVVEFGPGGGTTINEMAQVVGTYHGIEINKKNYENLKRKHRSLKNIVFTNSSAENYNGTEVDVILAFAMIYYCDLKKLLACVAQSLTKNGVFLFCQTNKSQIGFKPSRNTIKYYSLKELRDIFESYDLKLEVYRTKIKFWEKPDLSQWLLSKLLSRIKVKIPDHIYLEDGIKFESIEPSEKDDTKSRVHYFIAKKK